MNQGARLHGGDGTPAVDRDLVRVSVLGPLAVETDGGEVHVAGSHRRRLLALLASRAGRMVSVDAIVDALWGEEPPPTAAKTIQSHVVRLRRSLRAIDGELIETVPGGYRLAVDAAAVDAVRFERLVADGRGSWRGAPTLRRGGCSPRRSTLWRGPAYAEFADAEFAIAEGVRLDELRLRAIEDLAEAQLAGGTVGGGDPRAGAPRRRGTRARTGVGAADAGAVRRRPPAPRPRRLPAGAAGAGGLVRPRTRPRTARPRTADPRPGSRAVVVGDRAALPAALRTTRPMVGRRAELAWLTEAWETARRGTGQVRVVLGPVDGGRTRLAAELAAQVIADGGWVEYVRGGGGLAELAPTTAPPGRWSTRSPIAAAAARCCSSSTTSSGCRHRRPRGRGGRQRRRAADSARGRDRRSGRRWPGGRCAAHASGLP